MTGPLGDPEITSRWTGSAWVKGLAEPQRSDFDPVDWMSGALFVVYGSVRRGDPRTGLGAAKWRADATDALSFLAQHGIVLAKIADREATTLRSWRLNDLVCRVIGHRSPRRWYSNAAGDGGGWLCTRCLVELPAPEPMR